MICETNYIQSDKSNESVFYKVIDLPSRRNLLTASFNVIPIKRYVYTTTISGIHLITLLSLIQILIF